MLLKVDNMTCQHCVNAVTRALHAQYPAAQVQVDLARGEVRIHGGLSADAAIAALADDGYPATLLNHDDQA
jgi:copper chaperone